MKFFNYLQEEYYETFKSKINKNPFEIFINPSSKEMMITGRVDGSIRWVANLPTKMFFIWPGNGDLHEHVIPQLEPKIKFSDCILGSGIPRAGRILISKNDRFQIVPSVINIKEWEFAEKYFSQESSFIEIIKKKKANVGQ
jgi:hypothetical protein